MSLLSRRSRLERRAGYGFGDLNAIDPHIGWVLTIWTHSQRALEAAAHVAAIAKRQLFHLGAALGTNHSIGGPPRSPVTARIGYAECA